MTVECPSCATSFPVDPKKVPAGGVHARCSVCDGVFFVDDPGLATESNVAEAAWDAPESVLAEPEAVSEDSLPSVVDTEYVYEASEPSVVETEYLHETPEPGVAEPEAAFESSEPAVDEVEPAVDEVEPAYERPAPEWEIPSEDSIPSFGAFAEPPSSDPSPAFGEAPVKDEPVETGYSGFDTGMLELPEVDSQPVAEMPSFQEEAPATDFESPEPTPTFGEPEPTFPEPESTWGAGETTFQERENTSKASEPTFGEAETSFDMGDPVSDPAGHTLGDSGFETPREETPAFEATPPPPEPTPMPLPTPTFGRRDPKEKAQRLARVLVSDIILYNPDRHQRAIDEGRVQEEFQDEIQKSWSEYVDQVGEEIANGNDFFNDALNEILAKGRKMF